MTKDKELEDFFLANKPKVDDGEDFMAKLNHKLAAVEYLKDYQRAKARRYKSNIGITFILGIVCGGALLTYLLSIPKSNIEMLLHIPVLGNITFEDSRIFTTTILSCTVGYGVMSISNIIHDIISLKAKN